MKDYCHQDVKNIFFAISLNELITFIIDDQWLNDRRARNKYFVPKMIRSYITSFSNCADLLIEKMIHLKADDNQKFDLLPHLELCSVQGVCSTFFGIDLDSFDEISSRIQI